MEQLFSLLGLLLIVEGIPYFVCPEKMKSLLARLPQVPATNLRRFGLSAICAGLVILYIVRRVLGGGR